MEPTYNQDVICTNGGKTMMNKEVGKRIRKIREEKEMTREELANKAEITMKFLYEVESGKKGLSAKTLLKIATALSISCDYILLGVYRADDESTIDHLYLELLRGFNDKQRKIMVKILEIILEISEQKSK